MTTIIAVIFTVVATYAAGVIALYIGHRMSHIPFHLDVFDVVFLRRLQTSCGSLLSVDFAAGPRMISCATIRITKR